jgi:hypothetical protein
MIELRYYLELVLGYKKEMPAQGGHDKENGNATILPVSNEAPDINRGRLRE